MDGRNKKSVKICMLSTGHNALDDRIYYKETLSLLKQYTEIVLLTPGDSQNFEGGTNLIHIQLKNNASILSRLFGIPKAIYILSKIKPNICHFHDYELIFALPFLKLFTRCKIIYDVHEVYPEMASVSQKIPQAIRPIIVRFIDLSEKMLSKLTNYIIAADENIAKRFSNTKQVATIFNYPRLSLFVPNQHKLSELKSKYNGRLPIIYHGTIDVNRGLFKMIEAMQILRKKRPEIILLLIGEIDDNLFKQVRKEIQDKRLQESIDIFGWIPHKDLVNYIFISKIGLVPFLPTKKFLKNIPVKQFEYMACGIPVLGANLPPIASYILKAECGRVYNPTSSEELANGVIDIISNETEWKRLSEAGKKAVQNLWNWDQMESKLFDVYEKLLEY